MALTAEDGSGVAAANSYVTLAQATEYYEAARLHQSAWSNAVDDDDRARALIMATRLIDEQVAVRFGGWQGTPIKRIGYPVNGQGLAWPRAYCPDPDPINPALDPMFIGSVLDAVYLAPNAVPTHVQKATYETALSLLVEDRTTDPGGQGLDSVQVGPIALDFNLSSTIARRPLPMIVTDLLLPLTQRGATGGASPIVRT